MKKLSNLVPDIYKILDSLTEGKELKISEEMYEEFGKDMADALRHWSTPQDRTQKEMLRMSNIGKPERRLWFDAHTQSDTTEKLEPNVQIKFLYGHILEDLLILLSRVAGHTVTEEQKEVEVEGIKGHQDCKIDGVLVDCKSASGFAFKKFANNRLADDDPFGYIAQISAYSEGNGVNEAYFLAIDKQHGNIALTRVHDMEMINAKERVQYLKGALDSKTIPDRCYSDIPEGVSGNRKLAIGCVFCPHKRECWSDANNGQGLRVFKYAKGKRFLTQVNRTPDVEEVTNW